MKHACGWTAGGKPNVTLPCCSNAGSAGGKSAFVGQRSRHLAGMKRRPAFAIGCEHQRKIAVNGVAERDAVFFVPEGKAIVEGLGLVIGELELPVLAGVSRFVNARLLARPNAQNIGGGCTKSLDIAEIKFLRAFNAEFFPVVSAIH